VPVPSVGSTHLGQEPRDNQDVSLLKTKLHIPPGRPDRVPRPRLVEQLDAGLGYKITLISAPAGFGKTTLLSEWVAERQPHTHIAWISLDKGDNDPLRFWCYVITALETIHDGVGTAFLAALQTLRPLDEMLLTDLINEIAEIPEPLALILDDYHVITNLQVSDALSFFVEHLPPQIHLIVSTRADPPWPLARWRVRDEVIELRTDDLRFTPSEAARFLNDAMGLDLSPEDIAALGARTEGWIAGLQLAALSMQGRDVGAFVRAFSGSHRFILDYLVQEVLDRQSNDIQEFLLQTSVLERVTASLCDALTGRNDSQTILEQLEQANLFLVPLDDERRWYRYHHLFADLLRNRLEQTRRNQVVTLHRRASAWCERKGLVPEAASHALAAGDVERVAHLAEHHALAMMDHGELTTIARWLSALPEETVRSQPWLCVAQAWPLAYAGQGDAVQPLLQDAEQALPALAEGQGAERRRIAGHLAAIRAYVLGARGNVRTALELAHEALTYLPEEDLAARGWATYYLGFMLRLSGDLQAAAPALDEALGASQAVGDSHIAMLALGELGVLRFQQGQLHEAAATYRQALALADEHGRRGGRRLPATGYVLTRLSGVLREWNELETATQQAQEGLELCKQWQQADALMEAYLHLARALQAAGDVDGAREAMRRAAQVASDTSSWFASYVESQAIRMWLAQGAGEAGYKVPALQRARKSELSADDEISFQYEFIYRMLARVLIAQGESDKGLRLLARLLTMVELAGATGHVIEIRVLQAMTLQAQGKVEQALAALERALALAEPEGYIRTFIDEGAPMSQLLRQAVMQGIAVDYAGKLLAALKKEKTKSPVPLGVPEGALPPPVEPLSPREAEILRLLTTHLSHTEIAEQLVVSVNTVRSHIKNIYSKLGVHARMEAVQRARKLGLLD
jgi:LuxR family maltose regulon positive regulatory protein